MQSVLHPRAGEFATDYRERAYTGETALRFDGFRYKVGCKQKNGRICLTSNELIEENYTKFLSSRKAGKDAEAADAAALVLEGMLAGVLYQKTGKQWSDIQLDSEGGPSERTKISYLYRNGLISKESRKRLEWIADSAKMVLILNLEGTTAEGKVEMLGTLLDLALDEYFSIFRWNGAEKARAAARAGRRELEVYGEKILKRVRMGIEAAMIIAIGILSFRLWISGNRPDFRAELLRTASVSLTVLERPVLWD